MDYNCFCCWLGSIFVYPCHRFCGRDPKDICRHDYAKWNSSRVQPEMWDQYLWLYDVYSYIWNSLQIDRDNLGVRLSWGNSTVDIHTGRSRPSLVEESKMCFATGVAVPKLIIRMLSRWQPRQAIFENSTAGLDGQPCGVQVMSDYCFYSVPICIAYDLWYTHHMTIYQIIIV